MRCLTRSYVPKTNIQYFVRKSTRTRPFLVRQPSSQLQQKMLHRPLPQHGVGWLRPPQSLVKQFFLLKLISLPPTKYSQGTSKLFEMRNAITEERQQAQVAGDGNSSSSTSRAEISKVRIIVEITGEILQINTIQSQ